jgi:oxalate decarboxylase
LAKNFQVPESTFDNVPKKELFIFQSELPGPLTEEQKQASQSTSLTGAYSLNAAKLPATKTTSGGHVKIIDSKLFPVTPISAAIVTLKPGGLRELHWHPNADEWQYYITGQARMTVFAAASTARTMDFQEGDVGYVPISQPHYIENTGDSELVFLELFKSPQYQDISLAQWMAHTPHLLMDEHLKVGQQMLAGIAKEKAVVRPL